jgi:hypothetical protein
MQRSTFWGGGVGYSVGNFRHKNLVSGEFWCRHPHAKISKFIDISTCRRHVADMPPTCRRHSQLRVSASWVHSKKAAQLAVDLRGQSTSSGDRLESPSPWKASTWAIQEVHPFPEHSGRGQRNAGTRILRERGSSFLQKIKQPPFSAKDKACKT